MGTCACVCMHGALSWAFAVPLAARVHLEPAAHTTEWHGVKLHTACEGGHPANWTPQPLTIDVSATAQPLTISDAQSTVKCWAWQGTGCRVSRSHCANDCTSCPRAASLSANWVQHDATGASRFCWFGRRAMAAAPWKPRRPKCARLCAAAEAPTAQVCLRSGCLLASPAQTHAVSAPRSASVRVDSPWRGARRWRAARPCRRRRTAKTIQAGRRHRQGRPDGRRSGRGFVRGERGEAVARTT
eukprot:37588-Chlamydomonas_euryale.AAC.4